MPSKADNPLLHSPRLPHDAPPFDSIKPKHFSPAFQFAFAAAKKDIEAITTTQEAPTFENTVEALEFAGPDLVRINGIFNALAGARSTGSLEKLKDRIQEKLIKYESDVYTNSDLFARIKAVYDRKNTLSLDIEQKSLLERTYNRFVRSGALLDKVAKKQLLDIEHQLSKKIELFKRNLYESGAESSCLISDESELSGISERAKSIYKEAAKRKGHPEKWLIDISFQSDEFLENCSNRPLRRKVHEAKHCQAYGGKYDNRPVVMDILRLRHKKAQLLGYNNYAEFEIADCMAGTPQAVIDLVQKTGDVYKAAAQNLMKEVSSYALKTDGLKKLEPWDFEYYHRKMQEEAFEVSIEDMRNYFELNKVLEGFFAHAEKLFGIEIKEVKGKYSAYRPDVKTYEVADKKTGHLLGIIYGDFHARPDDKNDNWVYAIRERGLAGQKDACPLIILSLDLANPGKGRPTLMAMEEIETLFHEFGHGLQSILAKGKYPSQNGTNVTFDFLETASQILELWARNTDVLMSFARHWKTGAIPNRNDLEKYVAHEKAHAVNFNIHQHFLTMLDLTLHATDPEEISSLKDLENKVAKEHWIFPGIGRGSITTHNEYLEDYAGKYYTYPYDAVLAAAIYEECQTQGLHPSLISHLRKLYESGAYIPPMDLVRAICKDPLNPDALLRRDGLKPPIQGNTP